MYLYSFCNMYVFIMCSILMLYNSIILRLNKQFQLWSVSLAHTDHMKKSRGYLAASPTRLKSCRYTTVAFSI